MKRRIHSALLSVLALVLGTGVVLLGGAGPVQADAIPGNITLSPSSGTTADNPPFTSIQVDQACPEHYRDYLTVSLASATGRTAVVLDKLTAGGPFDAPFTATVAGAGTIRTLKTAMTLAAITTDGTYPVTVACRATDAVTYPNPPTFQTAITVTGTSWVQKVVTPPTSTSVDLSASPAGHVQVNGNVTLTARLTPAAAAGTVVFVDSNGTPVITPQQSVKVTNGQASLTFPVTASPHAVTYEARFTPDDATAFAASTKSLPYALVDEPGVTALDDTGNNLGNDNPTLTAGQKLKLSITGFLPAAAGATKGESVDIALDAKATTPASADSTTLGALDNVEFTVPSDTADGVHNLEFKGHTSGITVDFGFTIGAGDSGDTAGSTAGDTSGDTAGDTAGDTSGTTAGDTAGDTAGTTAGDTAGDAAGTTAGDTGGTGDSGGTSGDSGGTSGGSNLGPLAATGAGGAVTYGVLSLLLVAGGGYLVHRVRRDGKLLTFGSGPRD